jgi:(1->4)-alpha-D-glucan 1-alpha-D-glucosylmutase
VEAFHKHNLEQCRHWPHTLLASATHDTKRGEDVRARVNVISEIPEAWREAVTTWSSLNARHKTKLPGGPAPDANDEYLFYQVLAGCWVEERRRPDDPESIGARMSAYMIKALKESKRHATWTDPNAEYEDATTRFVKAALSDGSTEFLAGFRNFQGHLAYFGVFNSLSQTLLKLASPGVPDTYQGTELWDFSLVDPDNRRQVDYELRRNLLADLTSRFQGNGDVREQLAQLLAHPESGQIKLYVIWRALQARNARRGIYDRGDYVPLSAAGDDAEHVIAFGRRSIDGIALVIVPRLTLKLMGGRHRPPIGPDVWRGTRVQVTGAPTRFRNVMTNEILTAGNGDPLLVGQALSSFPVALLISE